MGVWQVYVWHYIRALKVDKQQQQNTKKHTKKLELLQNSPTTGDVMWVITNLFSDVRIDQVFLRNTTI